MKKLIAFTGKKGHGKSTACEYIERTRQSQGLVVRINFKDALVQELKDNFPDVLKAILEQYRYTGWDSIDDLFREKPPIMRELMQNYGTELRRKENKFYWTNAWQKKVDQYLLLDGVIVLNDDTRFLNEASIIKQNNGIIIRIIREGIPHEAATHQSETEMDQIQSDHIITAVDVEELERKLEEVLQLAHI